MNRLLALCLALLLSLTSQLPLAADLPPGGVPPMDCGSGDSGATCDGSGPASQGNTSGTDQGAGNPIHVITGNKYQNEVDMPKLPGVLGLELIRHYNSVLTKAAPGILGRGWRLSYETELTPLGNTLQVMQADGSRILFIRDPKNPSQCATQDPARGRMKVIPGPRGEEYVWTWPNGRSLHFDPRGKLTQIKAPTGEFVTLTRDPAGLLMKVTDPQGRSLVLGYPPRSRQHFNGVVHIDSPTGRFSYAYGNQDDKQAIKPATKPDPNRLRLANLTRVTAPDHNTRQYHYEDPRFPHHLTGISLTASGKTERLSTYGYDLNGLGKLSTRGRPLALDKTGRRLPGTGLQQVTLDYAKPGQTTLTDSQGRKTVYRHALVGNAHRLLEVKGPGCALCGESNVKYGYDKLGRLTETTRLSPDGRPIRTTRLTRDNQGRVSSEQEVIYTAGRPGPARLTVRYEYAGSTDQPTLIARPSVVPGKEHQVHLTYNDQGQVLRVTETGWAPTLPSPAGGRGAGGDGAAQKPTALTRTTTYAYTRINGRSLLAQIDGPLANGPRGDPSDSDVTQYRWDPQGNHPITLIQPGLITQSLRYDPLGRTEETSVNDGARTDTRRLQYSPVTAALLQPESVERLAWQLRAGQADPDSQQRLLLLRARFDAQGRRTEVVDGAGRTLHLDHDLSGHLIALADGSGHVGRLELDSEGRVQRAALYRPEQNATPWRASYYWYDDQGRRSARLRPDGQLDTWAYDQEGRLAEHIDGDEIRTRFLRNAEQSLRIKQSPDGWIRLSDSKPADGAVVDDFGQVLRLSLPDHGNKAARYDAAGRIVEIVQADASRIRYDYDIAGRLLGKTSLDAQGNPTGSVRLNYQGRLLAARQDDAQTSRFDYDALGRPTAETIQLTGQKTAWRTEARYDPASGLITARVLADGRVLRIQRNDPRQGATPSALRLQPAWVAATQDWTHTHLWAGLADWLGRWLPGQDVASHIAIDPFDGLTAHTAGNGLTTKRAYDLAGRLTRLDIPGITRLDYRYSNGPRVQGIDAQAHKADYRYIGFGRLDGLPTRATNLVRDAQGRTLEDSRYRYTYTPQGQIDTVTDPQGRLIARYRYNSLGQRVSKTVYRDGRETTTHTLWQGGNRVAEIDSTGQLQAQYLYLAEGQRATPLAKLEADHLYAIHTDHRGAPLAMTDEDQTLVWQADISPWGTAKPTGPASLNLRLPGQYYDEETGLHDNWHRTYDPATGRYLQPDPLGYPDGPDAYLYASGDPVNHSDPTGLYQSDVHYYLTYFLGIAAGIDQEDARIIALADQYIDDNPLTWAVNDHSPLTMVASMFTNEDALTHYHFTMYDYVGKSTDLSLWSSSGQIMNLLNAPDIALQQLQDQASLPASMQTVHCKAPMQLMGEALHALQDTFGHRNADNESYSPTWRPVGIDTHIGIGHGLDFSKPDYTYDFGDWTNNYSRTMDMAKTVFDQLVGFAGKIEHQGHAVSWSDIEGVVSNFAKTEASEQDGDMKTKIAYLAAWLGDDTFIWSEGKNSTGNGYNKAKAEQNRIDFLKDLNPSDYPGVMFK